MVNAYGFSRMRLISKIAPTLATSDKYRDRVSTRVLNIGSRQDHVLLSVARSATTRPKILALEMSGYSPDKLG